MVKEMQARILIVDDDPKIRKLLGEVFDGGGYEIREAGSALDALQLLDEERFDLITLDLQLGAADGLDLARRVRRDLDVPIIIVTGRDDVVDRVVGLELEADDYITKPFHVREVLARVRSVLRRAAHGKAVAAPDVDDGAKDSEPKTSLAYRFDGFVLVPDRFELFDRNNNLCEMTSGDFKLLNVFVQNAKRVLSRDRLMDLTGGIEWSPLDRTIDNQVARLRKKIERNPAEPRLIKTIRGIGYSFACDVTRVQPDDPPEGSDQHLAKMR